ncbi:uncharacterized protein CXorf49 homolog [Phyllostomus hastatus]|uniref:uncharacterized protein CXorf49 homolog n=1 Tax=Phyllostomus hastatus TaxID=9423 RepID=UPI001E6816CB|nr:uncharacterized protein CXorf49 homolog [Phyllostomus hastatus]
MEVAEQVAQGWEGRSGSPADSEGATWALFGNTFAMPLPQRLRTRDGWGSRRSLFPESRDREVSTVWLEPEPGPRGRGTRAHGWLGSQISPGVSFHFRGPEGDCVWGSPKQGVRYRSKASVDRQRAFEEGLESLPWSESELSDQFSEMQLTGGSIRQKGGGWAKLESLSDTRSPWSSPAREKFLPMPGPCLSFAPQTLSSGEAGQAVRDPEVSSEEPLSVPWVEAGSGPSYLPLVAAAGELPKATPRGNVAQEVTALERATKVVLEGFCHMPGQRGSGAPQDPATSSWIGGVPLFGTGNSHALAPIGTKESKPTGAGQESVAQRNSGSEPVVGEGDAEEPGREPFPESESPTQGQTHSFPCGYGGESDTGAVSNRHAQDPAQLEPLALSEEEVLASGPAPSSDLEPPEELSRPERLQQPQQPLGAEACPRLEELQRGLHAIRQQPAAMQSLAEKLPKS